MNRHRVEPSHCVSLAPYTSMYTRTNPSCVSGLRLVSGSPLGKLAIELKAVWLEC